MKSHSKLACLFGYSHEPYSTSYTVPILLLGTLVDLADIRGQLSIGGHHGNRLNCIVFFLNTYNFYMPMRYIFNQ